MVIRIRTHDSEWARRDRAAPLQIPVRCRTRADTSARELMHSGALKSFAYSYLPGSNLMQKLVMPNDMSLTQSYEELRDLLYSTCTLFFFPASNRRNSKLLMEGTAIVEKEP